MVKISRSWCLRSNLTTEDKDMGTLQQGGGGRPPGTGDAKDKRMHSEAGGDDKILCIFLRSKVPFVMNGSGGVGSLPVCEAAAG